VAAEQAQRCSIVSRSLANPTRPDLSSATRRGRAAMWLAAGPCARRRMSAAAAIASGPRGGLASLAQGPGTGGSTSPACPRALRTNAPAPPPPPSACQGGRSLLPFWFFSLPYHHVIQSRRCTAVHHTIFPPRPASSPSIRTRHGPGCMGTASSMEMDDGAPGPEGPPVAGQAPVS
jgi:hypothetical protein